MGLNTNIEGLELEREKLAASLLMVVHFVRCGLNGIIFEVGNGLPITTFLL